MCTAGVGQPTWVSQVQNPRRAATAGHAAENHRCPRTKGTAATPKEAQQEPAPPPAGGEEEDKASPSQKERNPTHINRDHQRWGPQPKPRRLAIVGEREAENRQTEQKRVHHKSSQGIEAKISKKEQKSPNYRKKSRNWGKNRHIGSTAQG